MSMPHMVKVASAGGRFYGLCLKCAWTGPERRNIGQASHDAARHANQASTGDQGP